MKKRVISILSIISLILTFVIAEIFSIYHFLGSVPTLLTTSYLVVIFAVLEYIFICSYYVINKLIKKEVIGIKKIIGLILLFISLMLVLYYIVVLNIDYLNWYVNSAPFYLNIIFRGIEILIPALIIFIIGFKLTKKKELKK